jgi:hypothetical protein
MITYGTITTINMTIKYNLCEQFMETVHITCSSIFDTPQQKDNWKSCGTTKFKTDPRTGKFAQLT